MSTSGCRAFLDDLQLIVMTADTETALAAGELHAQSRWAGAFRSPTQCVSQPPHSSARPPIPPIARGRVLRSACRFK